MSDPFPKNLEIWFRRKLVRILGFVFSRNAAQPHGLDYNGCKFLFIRQDMIGDVLVSTPLFAMLKNRYPHAVIDVLLSAKNHFVLENDPAVRKRWIYRKNIREIFPFLRAIRKERYDFAVDLMDNPSATSTILCLLAGARWNVGIAKENQFSYDIVVPLLSRRNTHIVERIAQLLIPFGIDPETERIAIRYHPSRESEGFADQTLDALNPGGRPVIGVNLSAGGEVRYWGTDHFIQFTRLLLTKYPEYAVLLLYKPAYFERAKTIAGSASGVLLSPVTKSFDQFAALIRRLSLLITPDTSAVHLASAFHIPAVVLYVQSDKGLRIWEPYGTEYETLVTDVDDLRTIPVADVATATEKLLQRVARATNSNPRSTAGK